MDERCNKLLKYHVSYWVSGVTLTFHLLIPVYAFPDNEVVCWVR